MKSIIIRVISFLLILVILLLSCENLFTTNLRGQEKTVPGFYALDNNFELCIGDYNAFIRGFDTYDIVGKNRIR